ncbi:unnamed protein product [Notodromas monacha]|uniref:Ig-like domain-containing protein n=1 Tax=Notodromas monacha TaxID=399045 RepID=A0A7R9BH41_9CRUS|nr:unnamed protein product [Notodromas monacha]CAG0914310.1 unnamed protein product [Notodromas monacha]
MFILHQILDFTYQYNPILVVIRLHASISPPERMANAALGAIIFANVLLVVLSVQNSTHNTSAVDGELYCPNECSCSGDTLRCKNIAVVNSTFAFAKTTRILDFKFTAVQEVPPGIFQQFGDVHTLILSSNEIHQLRRGAFQGLHNLKYLHLYKNQIFEMEADVFVDTPNLEHLYLHYNKLKSLQKGAFASLSRMQRLRLDGNPLHCNCSLKWMIELLASPARGGFVMAGTCAAPPALDGWDVHSVSLDKLNCTKPPHLASSRDYLEWVEKPFSQAIPVASADVVEFRCDGVGYPEPEFFWQKDGFPLTNSSRISISTDGKISKAALIQNVYSVLMLILGKILSLSEARTSDKGRYDCIIRNAVKNLTSSANLHVPNDIKAPKFVEKPPQSLTASVGSNLTLFCIIDGNPVPNIQWTFNEFRVTESPNIRYLQADNFLEMAGDNKLNVGIHRRKRFQNGVNLQSITIVSATEINSGTYECVGMNDVGLTSSRTQVEIITPHKEFSNQNLTENRRDFLASTVLAARESIETAVEDTVMRILQRRDDDGQPSSLLQVFQNRNSTARQLATAGEVFERTLAIIDKHVQAGLSFNAEDFSYKNVLNTYELNLISTLSGCNEHRHPVSCSDHVYHEKYRSIDGTCNNLQKPFWGASLTGFHRLIQPIYENGLNTPIGWNIGKLYHGFPRPSARLVSTSVISSRFVQPDEFNSHMVMQWGQFLDHDLDHAIPSLATASFSTGVPCNSTCLNDPPCFPITIPAGDLRIRNRGCMEFTRSSSVCGSGTTSIFMNTVTPREQINQVTAFIDGSQVHDITVYGSTEGEARILRNFTGDGLLRVGLPGPTGKGLLPINENNLPIDCRRNPSIDESEIQCFLAGDVRVNVQVGLTAMHTLWLREHNRIANVLKTQSPSSSGDEIFAVARKIVGAEMQVITYEHWLPKILGPQGMANLGSYTGYNSSLDPSISNVFATAAFRFGHALVNPVLLRLDRNFLPDSAGHLPLHLAFFSPWRIINETGIDPLLRGLMVSPSKSRKPVDEFMNVDLTERLFEGAHRIPLDLAAINIQRGRDHGLPGYGAWRKHCGFGEPQNFDELWDVIRNVKLREKLFQLYGHPGNMDPWVGFLAEDPLPGSVLGPTPQCIIVEQFKKLRNGDRFWYEKPGTFTPQQLQEIRKTTLAKVICDNGDDIEVTTPDVFTVPAKQSPHFIPCFAISGIDLTAWRTS